MSKIYRYILRYDNGSAPCLEGGWVSLATCKPRIRKAAEIGDWVLGFRSTSEGTGKLVWAGRIDRKIPIGAYERQFTGRRDAIYRMRPDGGFDYLNPDYHSGPDERRKDLSAPVLTFAPNAIWYFGHNDKQLPENLLHLAAHGRNHNVNGTKSGDPMALERWLRELSPPGVHGNPRDIDHPCSFLDVLRTWLGSKNSRRTLANKAGKRSC